MMEKKLEQIKKISNFHLKTSLTPENFKFRPSDMSIDHTFLFDIRVPIYVSGLIWNIVKLSKENPSF